MVRVSIYAERLPMSLNHKGRQLPNAGQWAILVNGDFESPLTVRATIIDGNLPVWADWLTAIGVCSSACRSSCCKRGTDPSRIG